MTDHDRAARVLDDLESKAKEATAGPWHAKEMRVECPGLFPYPCDGGCPICDGETEVTTNRVQRDSEVIADVGTRNDDGHPIGPHVEVFGLHEFATRDADFIAAANPTTVLQLVEVARAALEMYPHARTRRLNDAIAKLGGSDHG